MKKWKKKKTGMAVVLTKEQTNEFGNEKIICEQEQAVPVRQHAQ